MHFILISIVKCDYLEFQQQDLKINKIKDKINKISDAADPFLRANFLLRL